MGTRVPVDMTDVCQTGSVLLPYKHLNDGINKLNQWSNVWQLQNAVGICFTVASLLTRQQLSAFIVYVLFRLTNSFWHLSVKSELRIDVFVQDTYVDVFGCSLHDWEKWFKVCSTSLWFFCLKIQKLGLKVFCLRETSGKIEILSTHISWWKFAALCQKIATCLRPTTVR